MDSSDAERTLFVTNYGNLYVPNAALMLESVIRARLQAKFGAWYLCLNSWAITYLYGMLGLPDNLLDNCADQEVKDCFDKAIKRYDGGLGQPISKRQVPMNSMIE